MQNLNKILNLIWNFNKKPKVVLAFLLVLFSGFLDLFALYLIFPLLGILFDSKSNLSNVFYNFISFLGLNLTPNEISLILGIIILICFLTKCVISLFSNKLQFSIIFNTASRISEQLFIKYISQPYKFIAKKDNSIFIRNLTTEINQLIDNGLLPVNVILIESVVFLILVSGLFILDPTSSIIFFLVLLVYWYFSALLTGSLLRKWGSMRQAFEEERIKNIQASFEAIKEVHVYRLYEKLKTEFLQSTKAVFLLLRKHVFVLSIPKNILETIAITTIWCLAIYRSLKYNSSAAENLSFLVFFTGILFRIVPSAYKIANSLNSLNYCTPALRILWNDLSLPLNLHMQNDLQIHNSGSVHIALSNVKFSYDKKEVLNNINLSITSGDFIFIKGKSGAGKSTLCEIILGLRSPSKGLIQYKKNNMEINHTKLNISFVPQQPFIFNDTYLFNITLSSDKPNQELLNVAVDCAGLTEIIKSNPDGLLQHAGPRGNFLSGGQKQRFAIARSIYRKPELLILDEPTSALDSHTEEKILSNIKNVFCESCVVLISHNNNLEKFATQIYSID